MQRTKIHGVFEQDLKEAISWTRKSQYERMLANTRGEGATQELVQMIRTDSQLTQDDRAEFLAEVNGAASC